NLLAPNTGHKVQATLKFFRLHKLLVIKEDTDILAPVPKLVVADPIKGEGTKEERKLLVNSLLSLE
ncbi:hypothetical protein PanWU01x14_038430, partial [Parasponia andersonii]